QEVTGLDEPRAIPQKPWTGRLTVQKNIRTPNACSLFSIEKVAISTFLQHKANMATVRLTHTFSGTS
ncbi:hypothetical protein, partial [Bifidobacterium subtile]|uniref:hypothetical protein n=1 Tax=Bifidobacterium subtile TaxID=77635 RepID=UPI001B7FED6E